MVLRKSFYIRWSAGRSPRVHEVNPGRDPSDTVLHRNMAAILTQWAFHRVQEHPNRNSDEKVMTFRSWRSCAVSLDERT